MPRSRPIVEGNPKQPKANANTHTHTQDTHTHTHKTHTHTQDTHTHTRHTHKTHTQDTHTHTRHTHTHPPTRARAENTKQQNKHQDTGKHIPGIRAHGATCFLLCVCVFAGFDSFVFLVLPGLWGQTYCFRWFLCLVLPISFLVVLCGGLVLNPNYSHQYHAAKLMFKEYYIILYHKHSAHDTPTARGTGHSPWSKPSHHFYIEIVDLHGASIILCVRARGFGRTS